MYAVVRLTWGGKGLKWGGGLGGLVSCLQANQATGNMVLDVLIHTGPPKHFLETFGSLEETAVTSYVGIVSLLEYPTSHGRRGHDAVGPAVEDALTPFDLNEDDVIV